jgi:hypothetical protein
VNTCEIPIYRRYESNSSCLADFIVYLNAIFVCGNRLFLGTEKYKEENDYSKFLSENGGSSNAYTARDHTCYYFDVSPKVLDGALDRYGYGYERTMNRYKK